MISHQQKPFRISIRNRQRRLRKSMESYEQEEQQALRVKRNVEIKNFR